MKRREAFATSGTRIAPRFFAGRYDADACEKADWLTNHIQKAFSRWRYGSLYDLEKFKIFSETLLPYRYDIESLNTPNTSIKWPNDILSGKQKVCGILIEPNLQGEFVKSAIIGIGLNVNEDVFPVELPKATSLKIIHKKVFNLEIVMQKLLDKLDEKIGLLNKNKFSLLEEEYLKHLYKKDIVATFSTKENTIFSGIIKGVSKIDGKLQVLLENENIEEFGIQEIKFL
jgi:BirA family biotin operon repressor/biotin-[acetyl-CoA-carboxylase] ligase